MAASQERPAACTCGEKGAALSRGHPIAFTVFGVPQPAGSKRAFNHATTGRVVVVDDARKSRPWKQEVAGAANMAAGSFRGLLDGPLRLELVFWMPRPKGHYGTGRNAGKVRPSAPRFPAVKPDVLKLARAVEDALSGIVYRDDAQIVDEVLRKVYGEPARVEVRVEPVGSDEWPAARTKGVDGWMPAT